MQEENLYKTSLDEASALDISMEHGHDDFSRFIKIRAEINRFLKNLQDSHQASSRGQQIHSLFISLVHLDNVEKEIRASDIDEEIIRLGRILDKIRSLKSLILKYIKQLTSQE